MKNFIHKFGSWIVLVLAVIVYCNTFNFEMALDDELYILKNPSVQAGWNGIKDAFGKEILHWLNLPANTQIHRPFLITSFCIEKELWNNNPTYSHILNVLLYALACVLLFNFIKALFEKCSIGITWALGAALLFTIHPIHTEVVANIKSRDEIFLLLFGTTSFLIYIKFLNTKKILWYWVSVLLFGLSLLSKESGVTFLVVYPLLYWLWNTEKNISATIVTVIPFLFLFLLYYFGWRASIMTDKSDIPFQITDNMLVAASSLSERYGTAFSVFFDYIKMLFIPYPLNWDYSYPQIPFYGLLDYRAIFGIISLILLLFFGIKLMWEQKIAGFALLFYLATLSVTSNLVYLIASVKAERFLFVPSIGFCIAVILGLKWLLETLKITKESIIYSCLALPILVGGYLSYLHNPVWKNNDSLFLHGVKVSPNSTRTTGGAGNIYLSQYALNEKKPDASKLLDSAEFYFKKSVDLYPENINSNIGLGNAYYYKKDYERAIKSYERALQLENTNTNASQNLVNIANVFFQEKNYSSTYNTGKVIEKYNPSFFNMYDILAKGSFMMGDFKTSVQYMEKIIQIEPTNKNIINNCIYALTKLSDDESKQKISKYQEQLNKLQ